jgi:hypothetical protein
LFYHSVRSSAWKTLVKFMTVRTVGRRAGNRYERATADSPAAVVVGLEHTELQGWWQTEACWCDQSAGDATSRVTVAGDGQSLEDRLFDRVAVRQPTKHKTHFVSNASASRQFKIK